MKSSYQYFAHLCIIITLLSSCVGLGRYENLEKLHEKAKAKNKYCETSRDSLKAVLDGCRSQNESVNKQLLKEKEEKGALNQKLNVDINAVREDLATLQQNYDVLKNQNKGKIEELIKKLEIAQNDLKAREVKLKEVEGVLNSMKETITNLKKTISDALLGFKDAGLSINIKDGKVYVSLSEQLLFRSGSVEVEQKGKEALKELAVALENSPDINILIEGHTDNVPISTDRIKDNWDLSVMRATAIVRILQENANIDPKRFIASGHGEYIPMVENDSKENKAKNRRTEIILAPKLDKLYEILNQ